MVFGAKRALVANRYLRHDYEQEIGVGERRLGYHKVTPHNHYTISTSVPRSLIL